MKIEICDSCNLSEMRGIYDSFYSAMDCFFNEKPYTEGDSPLKQRRKFILIAQKKFFFAVFNNDNIAKDDINNDKLLELELLYEGFIAFLWLKKITNKQITYDELLYRLNLFLDFNRYKI